MRLIRAAEHRVMPWKNGQGFTTEIAVWPPGAALEDFDWRVSMASVAADGPFSAFAGIDRTLSVLEGAGMWLEVVGRAAELLTTNSAPYAFPGDAPTEARLVDGPITDLNVMSRRGRLGHRVERLRLAEAVGRPVVAPTTLVFCRTGTAAVGSERLAAGDSLLTETGDATPITLEPEGEAELFWIEFLPAQ